MGAAEGQARAKTGRPGGSRYSQGKNWPKCPAAAYIAPPVASTAVAGALTRRAAYVVFAIFYVLLHVLLGGSPIMNSITRS